MPNRETTLGPLLAVVVAAIALAIYVTRSNEVGRGNAARVGTSTQVLTTAPSATPERAAVATGTWAAAAPGRVEPKSGEIRLSPLSAGRIADVMVAVNDKVVAGDLLVKLDDADVEARIAAADAEASVRRRDRDQETVAGPARDRRVAEDAAFQAERVFTLNRAELDRWLVARKTGLATDTEVAKARETVVKARQALDAARLALRRLPGDNLPSQTRLEAALSAARAEFALADAASERMRIRAPQDGTILQLTATVGESVAPSPENVLVVMGDVSGLRVKAEVDARDLGKIRVGQAAVIRTDAFPGRDFEGKVTATAQTLSPSRLGSKGPRRVADTDVLEVTVELANQQQLVPGMRVDVFFRPDATASQSQAKSN